MTRSKTLALAAVALLVLPAVLHAGETPKTEPKKPTGQKALVEAAAKKAAAFLSKQCNEDGTYGQSPARALPGITALAAYALINSPAKPTPAKDAALKRAVDALLKSQNEKGAFSAPGFGLENYNTSIAVLALTSLKDPAYKDVLDKAKGYILSCQLDGDMGYEADEHTRAFGGFGYGSAKRADLSNTQFSLEALKELGVSEDDPAFKNALLFVRRTQDNVETNDAPIMKDGESTGGFVYLPGQGEFGTYKTKEGKEVPKAYGSMSYAGIKCLIYCGLNDKSPEVQAAWKWVRNNYDVTNNPGATKNQGYFYYIVSFAKAFKALGTKEFETAEGKKVNWAKDLAKHLVGQQQPDGSFANADPRWMESDPVLATSYALIALNHCLDSID